MEEGPKYGYHPEPEKSFLVVHPDHFEKAQEFFQDLNLNIVTGHRFLGGFIGSSEDKLKWLKERVQGWVQSVKKLSPAAQQQPQAAYVAFTRCLQNEWTFIQRVVDGDADSFSPLKQTIIDDFLPNLFGSPIQRHEGDLFCRPSRHGGLGVSDPIRNATSNFNSSREATKILSSALKSGESLDLNDHDGAIRSVKNKKQDIDKFWKEDTLALLDSFSEVRKRSILRKVDYQCSGWLSVIPIEGNEFDMSPDEFRDSLALRYGRTPIKMPDTCDADGSVFDLNHALNCPKGGLVYGRHNETRDLNCNLLELAGFKQVCSEPVIVETDKDGNNGLRADWGVRGFWEPQKQALFDVCILNADSPSLEHLSLQNLFNQRKNKKISTYSKAATARRATFHPILATCDAVFDKDAEIYIKRMGVHLSKKWKMQYSKTVGFIRARMQTCILRSVSLCIRGSRTKWRGAGVEDGAALPYIDRHT